MGTLTLEADTCNSGTIELHKVCFFRPVPFSWTCNAQSQYETEDCLVGFTSVYALRKAQQKTGWLRDNNYKNTLLMPYVTGGYFVSVNNKAASYYRSWALTID